LVRWHAVARERIERISDPARKEGLLSLAERLDPSAWTDVDQITAGLQGASEALERLSQVLARRRRRGKKRADDRSDPADPPPSPSDETIPDA
jgi:hypothetical protein